MIRALVISAALAFTGCSGEPENGCVLAAANRRAALQARAYLHPAIPARILKLHFTGSPINHAALVYRLPEGWFAWDDTAGTRDLSFRGDQLPDPLAAAHEAFPCRRIDGAQWF